MAATLAVAVVAGVLHVIHHRPLTLALVVVPAAAGVGLSAALVHRHRS